jgi:hypothetical protein
MSVVSDTGEKAEETIVAAPKRRRHKFYVIVLLLETVGWKRVDHYLPAVSFRNVMLRPTKDVTAHAFSSIAARCCGW